MGDHRHLVLLCAVVVCASGCGRLLGRGGQSVTIVPVELRKTNPEVTVATTLVASERITIRHPEDVLIKKIHVARGDTILAGEPLLTIDDTQMRLRLTQLQAERRELQLRLKGGRTEPAPAATTPDIGTEARAEPTAKANTNTAESELHEASLKRVEADQALVEKALGDTTIASPIDGLVLGVFVASQQTVPAATPLLEMVAVDPLMASFNLTVDQSGGVSVGDVVQVRIDELPGHTVAATVRFVGPELHLPDQTFGVWAALPNADGRLKIGMRGFAEFRTSATQEVLVVPARAIVMRQGRPNLIVVRQGVAHIQAVIVKALQDDEAILLSGVQGSDLVVVDGQDGVHDGMVMDVR